jgi:hypothetical protein
MRRDACRHHSDRKNSLFVGTERHGTEHTSGHQLSVEGKGEMEDEEKRMAIPTVQDEVFFSPLLLRRQQVLVRHARQRCYAAFAQRWTRLWLRAPPGCHFLSFQLHHHNHHHHHQSARDRGMETKGERAALLFPAREEAAEDFGDAASNMQRLLLLRRIQAPHCAARQAGVERKLNEAEEEGATDGRARE